MLLARDAVVSRYDRRG